MKRYCSVYRKLSVLVLLSAAIWPTLVCAQLPAPYFFDDFEDGKADDGQPASWRRVHWSEGSFEVRDGSLVLTTSKTVPDTPAYDDASTLSEVDVTADNVTLANASVRTTFRVTNPGEYVAIGITVRDNQVGDDDGVDGIFGTNIWFGLNNKGWNGFGYIECDGDVCGDSQVRQISSGFGGPAVDEAPINLRFDLFGDVGELWIWRADEEEPAEPRWRGDIPEHLSNDGAVNFFVQATVDDPERTEGWFDYVAVLPTSTSSTMPGDFNGDFRLTVADVDLLSRELSRARANLLYDSNYDGLVDDADLSVWIRQLKHMWTGDANLDGQFQSDDLVLVFSAGQYEDAVGGNSTWGTGDWNADGDFTSSDLVDAFQDGGYDSGPRGAASKAIVPEPTSMGSTCALGCMMGMCYRRRRNGRYSRPSKCNPKPKCANKER